MAITYKVWAAVASNVPPDPILAAAMIWMAHPQSIEATAAMDPMVLASVRRSSDHCSITRRVTYTLRANREDYAIEAMIESMSRNRAAELDENFVPVTKF